MPFGLLVIAIPNFPDAPQVPLRAQSPISAMARGACGARARGATASMGAGARWASWGLGMFKSALPRHAAVGQRVQRGLAGVFVHGTNQQQGGPA